MRENTSISKHMSFSLVAAAEESVVLVRWLADVCAREAVRCQTQNANLRAAVFLALASYRAVLSDADFYLTELELRSLEYWNDMYQDSLNCVDLSIICFSTACRLSRSRS